MAQASGPSSNRVLNYQLRLTSSAGVPVADGNQNIKLTFYTASSGGTQLYTACSADGTATGTPTAVVAAFVSGQSSILIGSTLTCASGSSPAIPATLFDNTSIFLGVTVSSDSEMTPRKRIVAAGYALNADKLDDLETSAVGGSNAFVPVTDSSGNFTLTKDVTVDTTTFFVDSTNNRIGVGTVTPDVKFAIADDTATLHQMSIYNANATAFGTRFNVQHNTSGTTVSDGFSFIFSVTNVEAANSAFLWNYENGPLRLGVNNTERLRLHASGGLSLGDVFDATDPGADNLIVEGSVGVGVNAPANPLDVRASTSAAGGIIRVQNNTATAFSSVDYFDNSGALKFGTGYGNVSVGTATLQNRGYFDSHDVDLAITDDGVLTAIFKSTGSVGIGGISSPGSKLVVQGSGTTSGTSAFNVTNSSAASKFFVRDDGFVGIGTASPSTMVHVNGTSPQLRIENASAAQVAQLELRRTGSNSVFVGPTSAGQVDFWSFLNEPTRIATNNVERIHINGTGEIGIGNSSPTRQLTIGTATTSGNQSLLIQGDNDAFIELIGDHGNADENGLPYIMFRQDYVSDPLSISTIIGGIGTVGQAPDGSAYTGTLGNNFLIGTLDPNAGLQLGTDDVVRLTIDVTGNVGIGDTTPDALFDVTKASTATTGATELAQVLDFTDTGIVTTGTDTTRGLDINLTRTGATGGTIASTGLTVTATGDAGGTSTMTGLSVTVSGADTNYPALFNGGNVGIGTSTPTTKLHLNTAGSGGMTSDATGNSFIVFDAGKGATAGNQISFIDFELDNVLKGNIAINEGTAGNPFEINSAVTNDVSLVTGGGKVGIATAAPESLLNVFAGSAGSITPNAAAQVVIEDNASHYIHMLAPDANESGLLFGTPSDASGIGQAIIANTSNALVFRSGGNTTRATLDSGGDFGVNVTDPLYKLHVSNGTSGGTIGEFQSNTTSAIEMDVRNDSLGVSNPVLNWGVAGSTGGNDTANTGYITAGVDIPRFMLRADHPSGVIDFATGGFTSSAFVRMRLDATGNLGIGDTTPDALLDVAGSFRFDDDGTFGSSSADNLVFNADVNSSILPNTDDTFDLGSNVQRWRDLYLGPASLHIGTSTSDEGILTYDTSTNVLQIDATGTVDIAGGSGSTGCTVDGSGNFSCTGSVTGSGGGAGGWTDDGSVVRLSGINDFVGIGTNSPEHILEIRKDVSGSIGPVLVIANKAASAAGNAASIRFGVDATATIDPSAPNAEIKAVSKSVTDDTDLAFSLWNGSSFSEVVRFVDNGRVGIGDSTPDSLLDVAGSFQFDGNGILGDASGDSLTFNGGTWSLPNDVAVSLGGGTNGINFDSNTLSIDAASNFVGIGTAAPNAPLHIVNNNAPDIRIEETVASAGAQIYYQNPTRTWDMGSDSSPDGFYLAPFGSSQGTFFMNPSGQLALGTTSPDQHLVIGSTTSTTDEVVKITGQNDAVLQLLADTDNVTETDNPYVQFGQDGFANVSQLGVTGVAGTDPSNAAYTGTLANALFWGTPNANPMQFGTNSNVRMTIDTAGLVGIGTNAPSNPLDVVVADDVLIRARNSADLFASIDIDSGSTAENFSVLRFFDRGTNKWEVRKRNDGNFDIRDSTAATAPFLIEDNTPSNTMYLDSGGFVGIGTSTPPVKLQLIGGGDVSLSNGSGSFVIGPESGSNMGFDDNEIMARSNGVESVLHFNADGGEVVIHNNQAGGSEVSFEDDGSLGLGTISPTAKLHVVSAANDEALAVTGYSLTGAAQNTLMDLSGTWNTSGAPVALKLTVTDTASSGNSELLDLVVGATKRFFVNKSGKTTIQGTSSSTSETALAVGLGINNTDTTANNFGGMFFGDGQAATAFGAIQMHYTDHTSGSEDGDLVFDTANAGSFGQRMVIRNDGNVGIGVASPNYKLEVLDSTSQVFGVHVSKTAGTAPYAIAADTNVAAGKAIYGTATGSSSAIGIYGNAGGSGTNYGGYFDAGGGSTNWGLYVNSGDAYVGAKVGLGTDTPSEKLTIADGGNMLVQAGAVVTAFGGFGRYENYLTYSEQFDNAAWTKTGVTVTADTTVAPDGSTSADSFGAGGSSTDNVKHAATMGATTATWTGSVWMKTASGTASVNLRIDDDNQTGTASAQTVTTSWQRFTVTESALTSSTSVTFVINNGTNAIRVWGGQLEKQSTVGAYAHTGSSYNNVTGRGVVAENARIDGGTGNGLDVNVEYSGSNAAIYATGGNLATIYSFNAGSVPSIWADGSTTGPVFQATSVNGLAGFLQAVGNPVAAFDRKTDDGTVISIQQDETEEGTISVSGNTVSYNAFTGSHYAWTDDDIDQGMLVSLTGRNRRLHGKDDSEILYGVAATTAPNDPRVLGAHLALLEPGRPANDDNPHLIMAAGNGDIWVVDGGANVEAGDHLVSSSTPGHAVKDPGTDAVSNVVARAMESIDWSQVTDTAADGKKHKKISVTFQAFARPNRQSGLFGGDVAELTVGDVLDFHGASVINVSGLRGLSGLWSIDDDGTVTAQDVVAQNVAAGTVTIRTDAPEKSVGRAMIEAGYEAKLVTNARAKPNALIIVTFDVDPGQRYWVAERHDGSFMVKLSGPASQDVTFTYWIVGIDGELAEPVSASAAPEAPPDAPPEPTPPVPEPTPELPPEPPPAE